jgi:hypothetical protein
METLAIVFAILSLTFAIGEQEEIGTLPFVVGAYGAPVCMGLAVLFGILAAV